MIDDDEIVPLSIAILAEHAYLPAGAAEKIATTALTHLRAEGWRSPSDGPVISARRALRVFMGRDLEESFSLAEVAKRMPLPSRDSSPIVLDNLSDRTIKELRWLRMYWTRQIGSRNPGSENSQMVVAWIEAEIARKTPHE